MKVKAAAFHEYNQAAVLDKLLTGMPEMVRAIAEPLSKVDKVTIVSTGNSGDGNSGLGASRLTGDIVNMVAQVPALFEMLSGTRIGDLLNSVPALSNQDGQKNDNSSANGTNGTNNHAVDATSTTK
jgi:flotillin